MTKEQIIQKILGSQSKIELYKAELNNLSKIDSNNFWDNLIGYIGTGTAQISEGSADLIRRASTELLKQRLNQVPGLGKYMGKIVDGQNSFIDTFKTVLKSDGHPEDSVLALIGEITKKDDTKALLELIKVADAYEKGGIDLDTFIASVNGLATISGNARAKNIASAIGDVKNIHDGTETIKGFGKSRDDFEKMKSKRENELNTLIQNEENKINGFNSELKELTGVSLNNFTSTLDDLKLNLEKLNNNINGTSTRNNSSTFKINHN